MKIELPNLTEFEKELYDTWVKDAVTPLTFKSYNNKTTVCLMKLKSGFEIVGTSGCEDPSKFNQLLGDQYALKDALRKLNEFAAFYRAEVELKRKDTKVLRSNVQLSSFEIEELRRLLAESSPKPIVRREPIGIDNLHKLNY